jgi:hypothetical protein
MVWTNLVSLGGWLERTGPMLPLAAGVLSIMILFGCALACWLSPSEEKDCLFHREVF